MAKVFIRNLPARAKLREIEDFFGKFGRIRAITYGKRFIHL